ncbi:MAG: hypothetical protein H7Y27_04925 [Gemmatimonadaceae bacterium]|nr:hypothetical protein [Chitinophagaceae bacterium]
MANSTRYRGINFRPIVSILLILVFAFSIAPKKFLHDIVADHHDQVNLAADGHYPLMQADGFTCHCDQLVAESPFTPTELVSILCERFDAGNEFCQPILARASTRPLDFILLRGPPASPGV